ncbi:MAG: hypothetical protein IAG13_31960, partial [Deltaproteobacteria bacterium]|nr:hypothetical protein [Nannocystaceae bacterium]
MLACNAEGADIGGLTSGTTESSSTSTPASTGDASSSAAPETTSSSNHDESHGETHEPPRPDGGMTPLLDVGSVGPAFECESDIGDYMFLLDLDGGLHRFSPGSLEIESLGPPDCEHGGAGAMALTVDRDGLLWAMMAPGGVRAIYTIDPVTLDCALTDFVDPLAESNISVNSLAFVADAPGGDTESLYIGANVGGSFDFDLPLSLGRVDLDTMAMEIVGTADMVPTGYYQIADLSGTGDSRLFGFFPGD